MTSQNHRATRPPTKAQRGFNPQRCEETVLRGVPAGPATCDYPLDEHGQCPNASRHIED